MSSRRRHRRGALLTGVQTCALPICSIDCGDVEYPVATSAVTAGWAATETGNVAGPTAFATTDRAMVPNQNLGIQMKLTRRALKQSGAGLEAADRKSTRLNSSH